jgi:YVTN family beta-propeller protein
MLSVIGVATVSIGALGQGVARATTVTSVDVGRSPMGVAISPNGASAWVMNIGSGTISVIDTTTFAVTRTIGGIGIGSSLAFTTDGSAVYVPDAGPNNVKVISTSTFNVVATIPVGTYPDAIKIHGTTAYVANRGGSVSIINTATRTVTNTFSTGTGPVGPIAITISPDGATGYVSNYAASVTVFNTSTATVTRSVGGGGIGDIVLNPAGTIAYVGTGVGTRINAINTSTFVVSTISVGNDGGDPTGIAVSPDGAYLYVTNQRSSSSTASTVSVISTATNTRTRSIPVGGSPTGIAVNAAGTVAYVTNSGSNSVSILTNLTAPSVPAVIPYVQVTRGDQAANVLFDPPDSGGSPITGYEYSTDGTTWTALVVSVGVNITAVIGGLSNGTTYPVQVRAVNTVGGGPASSAIYVTPAGFPTVPTAVTATAGNASAEVSFGASDGNGAALTTTSPPRRRTESAPAAPQAPAPSAV